MTGCSFRNFLFVWIYSLTSPAGILSALKVQFWTHRLMLTISLSRHTVARNIAGWFLNIIT